MAIFAGHTNSYHGFSLEEALAGICAAGFKYCELSCVKGWTEHVSADMSEAQLDEVKALLGKYGITPIAMSGHCNLMDKSRLSDFERNIELAAKFGCKYIISSTGEAHFGEGETFTNEGLINNIKSIIPVLEAHDMIMGLEIHGEHDTGEKLFVITQGANSARVVIAYDTANVFFYGKVLPTDDLKTCIGDVGYVHLKDHRGAPGVWDFPGTGNGTLPLKEFMDILDGANYNGVYSIEIEYTQEFTMREKITGDIDVANKEMSDSFAYLSSLGRV